MLRGEKLLQLGAIRHLGVVHRKLFDAILWCVQPDKGHATFNWVIHALSYVDVVRVDQHDVLNAFFLVLGRDLAPYTAMLAPYVGEGKLWDMELYRPQRRLFYNYVILWSCLLQFFA